MIEDLPDQNGIQWAVDFGLDDDEQLPSDIDECTMAQEMTGRFLSVLQQHLTTEAVEAAEQAEVEAPRLVVPNWKLDS